MFEHLGIIVDVDGNIVNHRSFIKVLFNPFLRTVGLCIGTVCDLDDEGKMTRLGGIRIFKHPRSKLCWKPYVKEDGWTVKAQRLFI